MPNRTGVSVWTDDNCLRIGVGANRPTTYNTRQDKTEYVEQYEARIDFNGIFLWGLLLDFYSFLLNKMPEDRALKIANYLKDYLHQNDLVLSKRTKENSNPLKDLPRSWEQAKASVPDLKKWNEVKSTRRHILDHLRDEVHGYGKWTLKQPGLPRTYLSDIDEEAYEALNAWLRQKNSRGYNRLPPDLYMPTLKQVTDILSSATPRQEWSARLDAAMRARERRANRGS